MSQPLDIAVIGATGSVGETLVQILEELSFPVKTLHLPQHGVCWQQRNVRWQKSACA